MARSKYEKRFKTRRRLSPGLKEAVGLQASSERVKRAHVKRKKADVQKAAVRASTARTGKKTAPIKKAAKRTVARDAAPPPVKAAPEAAGTKVPPITTIFDISTLPPLTAPRSPFATTEK